jgi:hypothetical protein
VRTADTYVSAIGLERSDARGQDLTMSQLPEDVRSACRYLFFIANGTLAVELLDGIDYRSALMEFGSPLEQAFAIFMNVLDVRPDGEVRNAGDATYRAAQYVRQYCDPSYIVEPPFERWETELV